jgi:hypothetical protein
MQVVEHHDPHQLAVRSHPWTHATASPACRYHDLRAQPWRVRTSLEDLRGWEHYPAVETFYTLLEWLNGPGSALESNDCAFSGPSPHPDAPTQLCSGRLMVLFRDLAANTQPRTVDRWCQALARSLASRDETFTDGAIGVTAVEVDYTHLPATQRRGQQVMLSFWSWGDDEAAAMLALDRTLQNLSEGLRSVG